MIGIILGAGIIVLYTSFGGIKSVAITDVLEFIILIVIMPIIAKLALKKAGGFSTILNTLPKSKFLIFKHDNFRYYLLIFIMYSLPAYSLNPMAIQRMIMAQSKRQIQKIFLIHSIIILAFYLVILAIGFSAYTLNPLADYKTTLPNIVQTILPIGLKGFAAAGILAIVMSTADSIFECWKYIFSS